METRRFQRGEQAKLGQPPMQCRTMNEDFHRGLRLFNRGHFFAAHEAMEDLWRSMPRDKSCERELRRHVQGLVQLAVAFHHESKGNHVGARSVLERALRNLSGANNSFPELDLDRLRDDLEPWRRYLEASQARPEVQDLAPKAAPTLPRINPQGKVSRRG